MTTVYENDMDDVLSTCDTIPEMDREEEEFEIENNGNDKFLYYASRVTGTLHMISMLYIGVRMVKYIVMN
jgi:hypothetical protein